MSVATLAPPTEACRSCGLPILLVRRPSGGRARLDPVRVPAGAFDIHDGILVRRSLPDMIAERHGEAQGGFKPHICPTAAPTPPIDESDDSDLRWDQR